MANNPQTPADPATQAEVGHEFGGHANFPPFDTEHLPLADCCGSRSASARSTITCRSGSCPSVGAVIEARKARIAKDLDEATAMQQKADAAAAAHEKALADARAKAQSLAQATRDKLAAEADAKRKALEDELSAKLAAAEAQIAATRDAGDVECRRYRQGRDRRDRRAPDRPRGGPRRRRRAPSNR